MTNLTDTATFSKKVFTWFTRVGTIVAVGLLIFFLGKITNNYFFPPGPPPATVAFEKLPQLELSEGVKPPEGITYKIETISGELPELVPQAKVFAIGEAEILFGDLERAKIKASRLGFSQPPIEVGGGWAKFIDQSSQNRILTIETTSGNFTLDSNFLSNNALIGTRPKSEEEAMGLALGFLGNFDVEEKEFPRGKVQTIKLAIEAGKLKEAPGLSSTNLMQFNFQRADIDKLPIINPQINMSKVWALVARNEVVAAKLSILDIQKHQFATYPLKGTKKAFEDLKNGKAAYNKESDNEFFPIRDVSLGYLETEKFEAFLQPVYLFKSDDGLIAYVDAVDYEWIKKEGSKNNF